MNLVWIFLLGVVLLGLLLGPLFVAGVIAALSPERGRELGNKVFGLGLQSIWRPAITFNAANELTLKKRAYDEKNDGQKITFGGLGSSVERAIFDPQNRIHDFFGTPFGFVDERFGIVVDPRDAAIGRSLAKAQQSGTYTRRVEHGERLVESVQGVFEFAKPNVGVRLPDVWPLVGGSFDAQVVRKINEFYRKSQAPKASTTALRQLLIPVATFIGIVLLGMFAAGQTGGGGTPAPSPTNNSTVNIGTSALLLLAMPAGLKKYDRRNLAVGAALAVVGLVVAAGSLLAFPMWVSILGISLPLGAWCLIGLGFGAAIPFVTAAFFGRSLGPFGELLGKLFIIIGLLGYDRPVVRLAEDNRYDLVEHDEQDWPVKPDFYRFALTRLGIGFSNDVDVWGDDVILPPARVREMANPPETGATLTDGGVSAPRGWTPTNLLKQDDIYGYVPKDVEDSSTYVRTDRTTGWFAEAGQNRRLMKAALEGAKEKFGGGKKPVGDKWILGFTFAAMVLGALFNWMVFF